MGVVTFYLVPQAFLNKNYGLFFMIFDMLLIIIILGMTFLAVIFFPLVEGLFRFLTFNICCRRDLHLVELLSKNMDGHRKRNSKLSLMLALALSFSIFATATFKMMNTLLVSEVSSLAGADFYVNCHFGGVVWGDYLDETTMTNFLESNPETVESYSFVSVETNRLFKLSNNNHHDYQYISSASGFKLLETTLYGVPENYLYTTNSEFYLPKELELNAITSNLPNGKPDCITALYNDIEVDQWPANSQDIYNITSGIE